VARTQSEPYSGSADSHVQQQHQQQHSRFASSAGIKQSVGSGLSQQHSMPAAASPRARGPVDMQHGVPVGQMGHGFAAGLESSRSAPDARAAAAASSHALTAAMQQAQMLQQMQIAAASALGMMRHDLATAYIASANKVHHATSGLASAAVPDSSQLPRGWSMDNAAVMAGYPPMLVPPPHAAAAASQDEGAGSKSGQVKPHQLQQQQLQGGRPQQQQQQQAARGAGMSSSGARRNSSSSSGAGAVPGPGSSSAAVPAAMQGPGISAAAAAAAVVAAAANAASTSAGPPQLPPLSSPHLVSPMLPAMLSPSLGFPPVALSGPFAMSHAGLMAAPWVMSVVPAAFAGVQAVPPAAMGPGMPPGIVRTGSGVAQPPGAAAAAGGPSSNSQSQRGTLSLGLPQP
jgi:hypothetical protein